MTARTRQALHCLLALVLALASASSSAACSNSSQDPGQGERELPPLAFRDDTPDLMLTWIDERGATHVETSTRTIPKEQARFVRVVIADRDERDPIYVADVSASDASGSYWARSVPRARWEDEIAKRRKEGGPALTEPAPPPRRRPPPPRQAPADGTPLPAPPPTHERDAPAPRLDPSMSSVTVIVYGASWCSACHKAIEHVKQKGAKAEFRDIEKDTSFAAEMKLKLARVAGGARGTIPVIDVAGQILVGYSPKDLDRALDKARGGTML